MGPKIRPASAGDAEAAAQVNVTAWQTAFRGLFSRGFLNGLSVEARTAAIAARFSEADYSMRVAQDAEGTVVGFADWGPPREAVPHDYELYAIYVLPEHQARGIGRALFREAASAILADGGASLMLSVFAENPHRPFYIRLGGSELARHALTLDNAEREVVWYEWQRPELAAIAGS